MKHRHHRTANPMPRPIYYISSALILGIALTGCGNKGPLYLPPAPIEQIAPEQAPSNVGVTGVEGSSEANAEEDVLPPGQEPEGSEARSSRPENRLLEDTESTVPSTPETEQ